MKKPHKEFVKYVFKGNCQECNAVAGRLVKTTKGETLCHSCWGTDKW